MPASCECSLRQKVNYLHLYELFQISRSAAAEFDVNRTKSTEDKRRNRLYDELHQKTSTATKTNTEPGMTSLIKQSILRAVLS